LLTIAAWLIISGMQRLFPSTALSRLDKREKKDQKSMLLVRDPQCGSFVPEQDAVKTSFRGQVLHFCSQECRDLYIRPQVTEGQEETVVTFFGRILITTLRQC